MATIDERVVSMAFENQVFEQRIAQTMSSLSKLEDSLKKVGANQSLGDIEKSANKVTLNAPMSAMDKLRAKFGRSTDATAISDIEKAGNKVTLEQPIKALDKVSAKTATVGANAADGFNEIERASSRVSLQGLTGALDSVTAKFSVLQGAAAVALGNITSQAVARGANFAKGFGVGPIVDGLHEYETNLKAIQTVQANTDQPLTKINKSLSELNAYSDQTIYNFGEMAKNVGTFTAAGVDLKTSVSSIKGIANMAALSGSSSQQAATAMYQLSQAISSGKVGLQDWNSVVNAGMGGKKLQNALAQTGVAMGKLGTGAVKMEGPMKKLTISGQSFRESIMTQGGVPSWLSSDILVNTLATLDGRFSKAALSAQLTKNGLKKYTAAQIEAKIATARTALEQKNGVKYTDAQFASLQKLSDSAFKSATEVKTLGQVFDIAKETIGSGWSASFQNIFGNLTEAKKLFTGMSGVINGFINKQALARNTLFAGWKALGGREDVIQGLKNIFNVLFDVLGKVGKAFREIFPRQTAEGLADLSKRFLVFTAHLNNSPEIINNIARTFKGFFAVIHIGWTIVKELTGVIFDLLGVVGKGSGGFLNFTGGLGDFAVALDRALTKGGLIKGFFQTLGNALKGPLQYVTGLANAFLQMFGLGQSGEEFGQKVGKGLENLPDVLRPLAPYIQKASEAWKGFMGILQKVGDFIQPFVSKFLGIANEVTDAVAASFSQANFDNILKAVQTGLLAGLFLQIRKIMTGGVSADIGGGFLKKMGGTFEALTGHLQAMQKNVQASMLLKIAGALALLAGAAFLFSTIPADKLGKAMGAMAISMGQLVAVMAVMTKVTGGKGVVALPAFAAALLILAGAMVVLAGAVKIFATMNWDELGRGLAGMAGGLAIMGVALMLMPPSLMAQSASLVVFAVGLNILASAVKQMASLSWEELGKGLLGVAVSIGIVTAAMILMPPNMAANGLAMMAMAFGVTILAGAVAAFGSMDVQTIAKGIGGIALAMMALAWAITGFPPTLPLQAAGLILVGIAMKQIGEAVGVMGGMSIWKLVKGLAAMGIALTELAVGLYLMVGSAPGAVALLAAAAGFAILGPALAIMGNLDWSTILKGLAAMALTMGLLAAAGLVLAAPLALIGVALLALGIGLLPVALSAMLLAKAFQILGTEGAKGIAVLIGAVGLFVASIPKMIVGFLQGIGDVLGTIAELAPKIAIALGVVIDSLLLTIATAIPKLEIVLNQLLGAFVRIINQQALPIINAGIQLLVGFLEGVSRNISRVVQTASDIIVKFLNGLTNNAQRLTTAGLNTMLAFLTGISNGIPRIVGKVAGMVGKFLSTVTDRLPGLVAKGAEMIVAFLNGISNKIGSIVTAGANLVLKFLGGLGKHIPELVTKGVELIGKVIQGVSSGLVTLGRKGADAVINFLNGTAATIREKGPEIRKAGWNLADAILDGIVQGFRDLGHKAIDAVKGFIGSLPKAARKVLGIASPSREFATIGGYTIEGFAKGVIDNRTRADKAVTEVAKSSMQSFSRAVISHRTGPEREFHEVGKRSVAGLKQGIDEGAPSVGSSMFGLAGGMVRTIKDVLQIRSPSRVLKDIGRDVGRGFREGLDGSTQEIRDTFRGMREKISEELRNQRSSLKEERKKLEDLEQQHADKLAEIRDLKKHPVKNASEIKTAQGELKDLESQIGASSKAISKYQSVVGTLTGANSLMASGLQAQKTELVRLSKDLKDTTDQLDVAQKKLDDVKQHFDDVVSTFNKLPDQGQLLQNALAEADMSAEEISDARKKKAEEDEKRRKIDQVANYKKALAEQIAATKKYQETLQKLRAMGLDDATYKKLLSQGVEGQEFATQLATGGAAGIAELNNLDAELLKVSQGIGEDSSKALFGQYYQLGTESAQGIVDGLKAKQADIQAAMGVIADGMVAQIKAALGIKSPSKVLAEVGKFMMDGLSKGVRDNQNGVDSSIRDAAQKAVDAAKESFGAMDMTSVMDVAPTITPVLDLSQIQKDANKLSDLTNVTPITAAASFGQATAISDAQLAAQKAAAEQAAQAVNHVELTQNNYSPEALSDIEIYRQTKNQLGQVKSALGLSS